MHGTECYRVLYCIKLYDIVLYDVAFYDTVDI